MLRGSILGGIVFGAATYIPKNIPSMRNRAIMAATVVIIYALLDYMTTILGTVRDAACNVVCNKSEEGGLGLDLDLDSFKL